MLNDPLSSALSKINNREKAGKKDCELKPVSIIIKRVLEIMHEEGYLGDFKEIEDGKGNLIQLNLLNNINKCNAIKPRHAVTLDNYEKFEKRFLPARNFGVLFVSTPKGIMTHYQAKEKKLGGKLIAYCY